MTPWESAVGVKPLVERRDKQLVASSDPDDFPGNI